MCPKEAVEVAYAKVEIENHTDPANPKFNPVDPKFKLIIQNEKMLPSKLLKKQKIDLSLNPERSPARFINVSAVVGKLFPQIASHNPYTTRILSGPDNHPETNLIVCIPTIAGKFPFEITAEGLVKWNRGLQNLENLSLDFITPGDIHVIKHICNQSLALKAQRFQNGKGVLMKVIDSMEASLQFFENDGCLLSQSGSITLAIDILLKNLGWVCSRDKLTVNTLKVWNQGILASSEEIACTLSSRLDNPSSGVIVSHANIAEFCESEEPLSGIQKKHLLDLSQSQIPGFKPITVAAIEVENAGVISGSQVTVKDIGISQSVATNKIGGKILATDILHIKINSCINKGLLFSQNQAIIIAKTFLQKLEGRLKTRNLLITTERLNNGGLISAENASLETEHFENTGVVELFGSEEPVTVSGKTVTNQGRMSASALVEIRTSQFKNTLKGLLSSQKLKLITDTIENFGLLEVLEELIVSDNSLTVNQGQITQACPRLSIALWCIHAPQARSKVGTSLFCAGRPRQSFTLAKLA